MVVSSLLEITVGELEGFVLLVQEPVDLCLKVLVNNFVVFILGPLRHLVCGSPASHTLQLGDGRFVEELLEFIWHGGHEAHVEDISTGHAARVIIVFKVNHFIKRDVVKAMGESNLAHKALHLSVEFAPLNTLVHH
jgi:hypothetical protein